MSRKIGLEKLGRILATYILSAAYDKTMTGSPLQDWSLEKLWKDPGHIRLPAAILVETMTGSPLQLFIVEDLSFQNLIPPAPRLRPITRTQATWSAHALTATTNYRYATNYCSVLQRLAANMFAKLLFLALLVCSLDALEQTGPDHEVAVEEEIVPEVGPRILNP